MLLPRRGWRRAVRAREATHRDAWCLRTTDFLENARGFLAPAKKTSLSVGVAFVPSSAMGEAVGCVTRVSQFERW